MAPRLTRPLHRVSRTRLVSEVGHANVGGRLIGQVGTCFDDIGAEHSTQLVAQPIFFVATEPLDGNGSINCSPKGNRDEFAVIDPRTVTFLDRTGSGVETIAHLCENARIVMRFCSFDGLPRIVRLHGRGRFVLCDAPDFVLTAQYFPGADGVGVRSLIVVDVDRISDSRGYGVAVMNFAAHRPTMDQWSNRKGPDGIRAYWPEKVCESVDGLGAIG